MKSPTVADLSEYANRHVLPFKDGVMLEHHSPNLQTAPFHFHPSLEINYLDDCDMSYSFSGRNIALPKERLIVFWGAYPHRVTKVQGDGTITNAYVGLSETLNWSLPADFVNQLLNGAVASSKLASENDRLLIKRWAREVRNSDDSWNQLHTSEIKTRLQRLCLEGWDTLLTPVNTNVDSAIDGKAVHLFDQMLRFIASRFSDPITVQDVAKAVDLSPTYATTFFKKLTGNSIKHHIAETRIAHAKMLLSETGMKVAAIAFDSGFISQSTFYDTFQKKVGMSPKNFRRNTHKKNA